MADGRLVPCNILSWPAIADLLPEQKFIFVHLWFSRHANTCGCYFVPVNLMAVELSLKEAALMTAFNDFSRRDLISFDDETGEIFVHAWFRFNSFTGPRQRLLLSDLERIQSKRLREIVVKTIGCIPREVKGKEGNLKEDKSIRQASPEQYLSASRMLASHGLPAP